MNLIGRKEFERDERVMNPTGRKEFKWDATVMNLIGRKELKMLLVEVNENFSSGAKYFFFKICCTLCEKVIFAFERSYTTCAMRKSMLNVPVPGSF